MTEENKNELSPEAEAIKAEVEASNIAEMDKAVVDGMSFDLLSPRLHRKEAQHLVVCPTHGIIHASYTALEASAGKPGMSNAEKIAALETVRGQFADGIQAHLDLILKHFDAAIEGYKQEDQS